MKSTLEEHPDDYIVRAGTFGVVPIYGLQKDNKLYTANTVPELASLLTHRQMNMHALTELLDRGYLTGTKTMFLPIFRIPPAHKLDSGRIIRWENPFNNKYPLPTNLLETLRACVNDCLPKEGKVGAYLSGGLDTSTIVALASQNKNIDLTAYTLAFNHESDEIEEASIVAREFNVRHIIEVLTFENFIRLHDEAIKAFGRPAYTYYNLAIAKRVAQDGINVVLSGEGSDEIFGSYQNSNRYQSIKNDPVKVRDLMYWEFENKLPYDYLEIDFAMAHASGIESRCPFCDARLLGYLQLPVDQKISFKLDLNKMHLRVAMKGILPERIMTKSKQGFSYPFLAHAKELKDLEEEAMEDQRMKKLFPNRAKMSIPQNEFIFNIGKKLLRSTVTGGMFGKSIMQHHPHQSLLKYSIWRWLELFNIEVGQ